MTDIYSKTKRAEIMSLVRGRGNRSTELLVIKMFRKCGINGWRRHVPLTGRPDFTFKVARVVVFIDGCFWHLCPIHGTIPKHNMEFWQAKLTANRARDRRVERVLRARQWRVIRIWHHDLRQRPDASMRRVARALERPERSDESGASLSHPVRVRAAKRGFLEIRCAAVISPNFSSRASTARRAPRAGAQWQLANRRP